VLEVGRGEVGVLFDQIAQGGHGPSLPCRSALRRSSLAVVFRAARAGLVAVVLVAGPAGCGFIGASDKPENKPDTFLLRGHATVPAPGDKRPDGAVCAATVPGIVAGVKVWVTGPDGRLLASGSLGDGVIAHGGDGPSCDFPFQIAGVPGGVVSYGISVDDRPAQQFPAKNLRENAEAIIRITA
jgi:hypothetical protein